MSDETYRSGGADINSQSTSIGGNVVGRDNIESHTTNYYAPQTRRAELPNQPYFFGREDELKIIAEALDPESNGWGVLIDGPGGIGKTALAIHAGHIASDKIYPTKIFLSAKVRELTPQGEQKLEDFMLLNFMTLITELARELGEEGIEKIDPNERAKEVRRALENRHALFIIDNLETFDEKERERLFQFLRRLPRSCKAIVTSRRRTDVAAEIIRLDRLKKEDALKLIAKLAERNKLLAQATDRERLDLYEVTKGNPLLIEWITGQLGRPSSQCRTIADACKFIESAPQSNDPLEYIFGDLLSTLTEHETVVLAALAHFTLPAKTQWIADLAGISIAAAQTALEDLTDRALVVSDAHVRSYLLPQLAVLFLRRRRPEIIAQTGDRLADHVFALVVEHGYQHYEHFQILESEWPSIAAALPLVLQSENTRLQTLCDAIVKFLEFSGRWDEVLTISMKSEEIAVSAEDFYNAGWRAYDAGWIYCLRRQASEVHACARRAESAWSAAGTREMATVNQLRGIGYQLEKNYPAAISAYRQAVRLFRALSSESTDVALVLNNIADVERMMDDYTDASHDYREALRIARKMNYQEGMAYITGNLAELALDRGELAESEALAREALSLAEEMNQQYIIAACCRLHAKLLVRQERAAEGLQYAQRAVKIYAQLRSPQLDRAQAVLKECGG